MFNKEKENNLKSVFYAEQVALLQKRVELLKK